MDQIFIPHELKTIEVDTAKKIFRINGEEFGRSLTTGSLTVRPRSMPPAPIPSASTVYV